jgi:lactoylglutathione lyase
MRFTHLYAGLRVTDLDAALRFYKDGLGMKEAYRVEVPETGGGVFLKLESDGSSQVLELNWYPEGSAHATDYAPGEALDHVAFRVTDASMEEAIRHLERHGGKLTIPPFDEGGHLLAFVEGPDGHVVELILRPEDR